MIRRPPRSTLSSSSAASDVYKRQVSTQSTGPRQLKMARQECDTPLLDMVVRRISEEVADVLKVDRRNVEQHLGACLSEEVLRMGGDSALAAAAGLDVDQNNPGSINEKFMHVIDRLDHRRDQRDNQQPPSRSRPQSATAGRSTVLGVTASPTQLCRPGQFSTRSISPRRSQSRPGSPAARTKQRTPRPANTGPLMFAPGTQVYRRGGGYSSTPPKQRPVRSPHQKLLQQQMDTVNQQPTQCVEPSPSAHRKSRRLNERQWETVVTRLYGNPGADKTLALQNSGGSKTAGSKKMAPWEMEQTVNRLYRPPQNDRKEEWLVQQRVEILGKELRSMRTKPQISRTSERMARGRLHIAERVDDVLNEKEKNLQELIREVEQGGNSNLAHMPYISPRAREKQRGYEDLMQWAANRAERIKQKEEALHVEEISSSFHPMINQHSSMIASRRFTEDGVPENATERLYAQRTKPSDEQRQRAELIHGDDFRHSSHYANH
eukprot:TRINITY_DN14447_c0_g1_i2.p1 TRINITY_DN14447_c0_g1~~TRINITY_DN14447_c0_g1_i2.p1  ORF type:complete len:492 (-),score=95.55 TRINITY_DN14447_c0_g1_i2:488-1963(-)